MAPRETGKPKRIALFGCGLWGRNILRDLLSLECLVVVIDPAADGRRQAQAAGATAVLAAPGPLSDVDGLIVAAPAATHVDMVKDLLALEVPIFCEKPLSTDLAQAEELARMAGDRLFEMHVWRYHPGVEKLAELARSGALGSIRWLRSTRANWTSPRRDVDPIWTLAPHDLSIVLEILGRLPPARAALAEYAGGDPVGMVGMLADDAHVVLEVSTRYGEKRREIRLHGDRGVAVLSGETADHLEIISGGEAVANREKLAISTEMPLLRELRAFLAYLDGGPPPSSSLEDSLAILARLEELRELADVASP